MTSQPDWKLIHATDDEALYVDTTGTHDPELEVLVHACGVAGVCRFPIPRVFVARVNGIANAYPWHAREYNVHELICHVEWYSEHLSHVADSIGATRDSLLADLADPNPRVRAPAYRAIGGCYGLDNFDSDPTLIDERQVDAWPDWRSAAEPWGEDEVSS